MVRALASHECGPGSIPLLSVTRLPRMWPGFDSLTQRHMWVEFVGSLPCTERFSQKPTFDLICVNC